MFIFSDSQEKFSLVLLNISQFQLRPAPWGWAFANFALPGGRAFANPRAIPELLTRTQFPIRI